MLAVAVIWFCRIGRPDWIIPRWSQSQHRQQGDKMLCRGIIRSFNGRFGYIHYQRNTKNLRFEASDLRGIEKPKAGQLVAFGFCLMAIARMYPAICFRRPTFRSSLNWENPSKPRDHCPGLVCALPDYVPEALTFRFLRPASLQVASVHW